MRKVYAEIYGCTANVADGEIALGILRRSEWVIVNNPEDADVILLVTCTVKKPTSDRMLHRINCLKNYGKKIVVAGCMASGESDKIKRIAPEALLLHPRAIPMISEVIEKNVEFLEERDLKKLGHPRVLKNPVVGIIPVSEGCRWRRCTFCIVPATRGRFTSYPIHEIVKEAENLLSLDVKEIWLTSQDMGSYGLEMGRNMLPELLRTIASIPGDFWIRVGMMNPIYLKPILTELAEVYKHPKIYKFLHIPIQSGSDKVLKLMDRGYTVSMFKEIVEYMKENIKDLTLSTDIIVGYPGEEEEDFEKTVKLIEEIKPDFVNISRFFPRPKTPAEKLRPLDPNIVKERSRRLTEITRKIALERNLKWVGWKGIALVDEVGERGEAIARNIYYKPIVLLGEDGRRLLGRKIEVEIVDVRPYALLGHLLKII
ncbi:MAG: tRNA (N(6)-L-threonylcarbamoyladenosine(37)-C(2))-methylthiotransferase [Nitrososphaerota archaeon]|nr:tRNA (N(6)-L-threonylcarbamoyladenosine(37)-C(2))-methylthiotransferase [Candidatus Geocrenenecus dongiae]